MSGARVTLLFAVALASGAQAEPFDFSLSKLGNPSVGGPGYSAQANANFRTFARQLGAGLSSVNLMPPETVGYAGFSVAAELAVVDFGATPYAFPTEKAFRGPWLMPSVHIRKGLPFSFELGFRGTYLAQSRMAAGTFELKWALQEGYSFLPDIGVRAFVTKLVNTRDFELGVGGLDVGVGKQFALGGMVTLTPYLGWNLGFVGAGSRQVDFQPDRPLSQAELTNDQYLAGTIGVFRGVLPLENAHHRFYVGLRLIGGVLQVGAEFSYAVIGGFRDETTATERAVPGVLSVNSTVGLDF